MPCRSPLFVTALGVVLLSLSACGASGGEPGNADPICADLCTVNLACAAEIRCKLVDPQAALDACNQSCADGLASLDPPTRSAIVACLDCIGTDLRACDLTPPECMAACTGDAVQAGGDALSAKRDALPRDDRIACTNGTSAFDGAHCAGDAWSDETNAECNAHCSNGNESVIVGAGCAGPLGTTVECQCTEGVLLGHRFSLPSCNDLFTAALWAECTLPPID